LPLGTSTVGISAIDGEENASNAVYEVTTTGTATLYSYDANGNLRFEREPNEDVRREFQWDQAKRLVRIIDGEHESVLEYDGLSRRVRIRELEGEVEISERIFIWCGANICQARTGTVVERNYFERGFSDGLDAFAYTRDHLGSVREVMAGDGVSVETRMSYDLWGAQAVSGGGKRADFGFTGHWGETSARLTFTLFRAYDPLAGRWVSRDPLGEVVGPNLYAYVGNKATNSIDPLGLEEGCLSTPNVVNCWTVVDHGDGTSTGACCTLTDAQSEPPTCDTNQCETETEKSDCDLEWSRFRDSERQRFIVHYFETLNGRRWWDGETF